MTDGHSAYLEREEERARIRREGTEEERSEMAAKDREYENWQLGLKFKTGLLALGRLMMRPDGKEVARKVFREWSSGLRSSGGRE